MNNQCPKKHKEIRIVYLGREEHIYCKVCNEVYETGEVK